MSESCPGCKALEARVEELENRAQNQPRIHTPGASECDECEQLFVKLTFVPGACVSLCDPCKKKHDRKQAIAKREAEKAAEAAKK